MLAEHSERLISLSNNWYVETRTGYEGPFDSYAEAEAYLRLFRIADAARDEFAGLAFLPS